MSYKITSKQLSIQVNDTNLYNKKKNNEMDDVSSTQLKKKRKSRMGSKLLHLSVHS